MTGKLPDVTDADFQTEVLDSETAGPGRFLGSVVRPLPGRASDPRGDPGGARGELRIVSLNVDENQQTAARYEVLSIPTLILFRDGAEAKRIVGAMPKRRLEAELEPALTVA